MRNAYASHVSPNGPRDVVASGRWSIGPPRDRATIRRPAARDRSVRRELTRLIWFVELKQVAESWEDSLRTSQRLWLEAASTCHVLVSRFLVLEWSQSKRGRDVRISSSMGTE